MGFSTYDRYEFISSDETKPVKEEFKKNRQTIVASCNGFDIEFVVLQEDIFTGKKVEVTLLEVSWTIDHNSQNNSYTAHCYIEEYLSGTLDKKVNLESGIGEYIHHLVSGMSDGDVGGETACNLIRLIFRELEIKNASSVSWVRDLFPKFFKQEETDIERQKRKIVKEVMKT